jgi:hypothetical protein
MAVIALFAIFFLHGDDETGALIGEWLRVIAERVGQRYLEAQRASVSM